MDFDHQGALYGYDDLASQINDTAHQSGSNTSDIGPSGNGRFVIAGATPSPYEFYSVAAALDLSLILVLISSAISFGWFTLRKGMTGPTEKCLKEQIRTILAPHNSKFSQI
ncbi:hypothetical protein HDV06_002035 [Boothiomyces sp. JEL0866]|nr:hypothetical protein HDV06_002035 [Boothiomyces sp. JEL0866]